jgi:outer membrane protein OmpA-like peptidoglycan-associated protein
VKENQQPKLKIMRKLKVLFAGIIAIAVVLASCASMNKTQKGAAIGTAGGAAAGAVIGRAAGNTALGAIIGATVGGVTGAVIGNQMDKQAEELKKEVPNANVERVGEGIIVELSDKVLFDFGKSDLTVASQQSLDKIIVVLNKYPDTNIEVQGHTDSKGSTEYNQGLSVKRATSVANYLNAKSIPDSRLTIKGYGEDAPKYTNDTEEGRTQNRRVEFLITANEKMKAEAEKAAGAK